MMKGFGNDCQDQFFFILILFNFDIIILSILNKFKYFKLLYLNLYNILQIDDVTKKEKNIEFKFTIKIQIE